MARRSVAKCIPPISVLRGVRHGPYGRPGGHRRHGTRRGQGGAVLLATLALTIVAGAGVLLSRFDGAATLRAREAAVTARALADARRALIGWSVGAGLARGGEAHAPGVLPFPDRNTDPYGYDGEADCVTSGLSDRHLIGRLARAGEASPCPDRALGVELRDGSGEPLWYAVSRNLVNHRGGGASRSADQPRPPRPQPPAYPWLRLIDANGARRDRKRRRAARDRRGGHCPGAAAARSDAVGVRARPCPLPGLGHRERRDLGQRRLRRLPGRGRRRERAHALSQAAPARSSSCIRTPATPRPRSDSFNDRIAWITAEELLRAAEARALGEMAVVLERYRSRHGAYPWLAPHAGDPGADPTRTVLYHATADGAGGTRRGMLPIHAMPGQLYDTGYTLRWTIDSGAVIATTDPSSIGSTPAPADAELYALASAAPQTTTRPAACAWNGDDGVHCAGRAVPPRPGHRLHPERVARARARGPRRARRGGLGLPPTARPRHGANPSAAAPRTRTVTATATLPRVVHRVGPGAQLRGRLCRRRLLHDRHVTGMSVERTLTVDTGTLATFTFTDLEYDLSVAAGRRPAVVRRQRLVPVRAGGGIGAGDRGGRLVAGELHRVGCRDASSSMRRGRRGPTCPALLIGSGPALPGQTRGGCGGACLVEYFEAPGNASGGDSATRAALAADFNDLVRVVGPPGTSP